MIVRHKWRAGARTPAWPVYVSVAALFALEAAAAANDSAATDCQALGLMSRPATGAGRAASSRAPHSRIQQDNLDDLKPAAPRAELATRQVIRTKAVRLHHRLPDARPATGASLAQLHHHKTQGEWWSCRWLVRWFVHALARSLFRFVSPSSMEAASSLAQSASLALFPLGAGGLRIRPRLRVPRLMELALCLGSKPGAY